MENGLGGATKLTLVLGPSVDSSPTQYVDLSTVAVLA